MEDQTQYKTTKEKRVARMNDNTVNNRRQFSKTSAWEKIDVTTLNRDEIEDKMKKLYEKSDGVWNCLACDYTTKTNSGTMRRHVETHLDGLCYTCNICSKEFRLRNSLACHKKTIHKQ